ncbi:hypothetical protein M3Y96_01192800 [Aphelenchoides besseyi]|nr:hypothetical protein M3Y96_01192800 [Aphelenchoides besseyi]
MAAVRRRFTTKMHSNMDARSSGKNVRKVATLYNSKNDQLGNWRFQNFITRQLTILDNAYLLEQNRQEKQNNHYFTRQQLLNVLFDLWFAGQETTSTTLTWGFAYLVRHPEAQQKLHAELDQVIGSDRLITMSDKNDLPYTNAVINLVFRCSNIVAQNSPRKTTREVEVANCKLPKGTIFPEPRKFNPDRFIDENGKLKRCDELMPFSIGKRQCLGEGIARAELFLFIANLCNVYKFYAGEKEPTLLKLNGGGSIATQPFKIRVVQRH